MNKSKTIDVSVQARTEAGTRPARRLRRRGMVPAVLYGRNTAVEALMLSEEAAEAVVHHPGLMNLTREGAEPAMAILKAAQRHPVSGAILHLDFLAVRADQKIRASVPVDHHGIPAGASKGGQLEQALHMLEIECLPADLPEEIVVDVSGLDLDATMHVRDLPLPEGVRALSDGGLVVFQVRLPKIEEVKEEAAEAVEGAEAAKEGEAEGAKEGAEPGKEGAAPAKGAEQAKGGKGAKTEKK